MIETFKVESEFYADEAIQLALRDGKSLGEMEQWGALHIGDLAVRRYFLEKARAVIHS